ncbi:hypothetical protein [Micrococcus lylae]|uniref:Transcriptional regulator, AbiEi antitoxin, Type IV TA system n=1 Tax=Micrococcus lylae TaxID=1273 RepID=A0ABY2JXY1_9MICC|nr:hypothetical protein [Micrococcus lylae]TFH98333.1 hypothetical protein E4A49_09135 [Micrococcus lylae]
MTLLITEDSRLRVWRETWAEATAETGSPILTAGSSSACGWKDRLRNGFLRGELVRLAHGAYVPLDLWQNSRRWDREKFCIMAVVRTRRAAPAVLTGTTALMLHGLPLGRHLPHVELVARGQGRAKPAPRIEPFAAPERSLRLMAGLHAACSDAEGDPPALPGTNPSLWTPVRHRYRARSEDEQDRPTVRLPVTLSDGTVIGEVTAESLAPALAVGLKETTASESLPVLDALAFRGVDESGLLVGKAPPPPEDRRVPHGSVPATITADAVVKSAVELAPTRAAGRRLKQDWKHASPLAESAGESVSRGRMIELGFEVPELQVAVSDADGFIARVDSLWRERGIVGEFDGIGKYDVDAHANAEERRRYLRRQQGREIRLQRVCSHVLHWTWRDVQDPARLRRLLDGAGVSRTARR